MVREEARRKYSACSYNVLLEADRYMKSLQSSSAGNWAPWKKYVRRRIGTYSAPGRILGRKLLLKRVAEARFSRYAEFLNIRGVNSDAIQFKHCHKQQKYNNPNHVRKDIPASPEIRTKHPILQ